jgi:hypothetical protein
MIAANKRPSREARHLLAGALTAVALLVAAPAAFGKDVQRCEDAAGRVTYSNEACPPGTKRSRAVDTSQPVEADAKAAPAERKDAAPRTVRVERTPSPPQALAVNKDALCRELALRVNYARRDLDAASPQQRASAELAMRRAQEDYDLECKTN